MCFRINFGAINMAYPETCREKLVEALEELYDEYTITGPDNYYTFTITLPQDTLTEGDREFLEDYLRNNDLQRVEVLRDYADAG
jgi:hypothetical protein